MHERGPEFTSFAVDTFQTTTSREEETETNAPEPEVDSGFAHLADDCVVTRSSGLASCKGLQTCCWVRLGFACRMGRLSPTRPSEGLFILKLFGDL